MPLDDSYIHEIWGVMRTYNLETDSRRVLGSFTPDIVARDKRTGISFVVEVKSNTPILTNVIQALAYYRKRLPSAYFIAFSPLGTYPDVREIADKSGIWIVSSLDELRGLLDRVIRLDASGHSPQ